MSFLGTAVSYPIRPDGRGGIRIASEVVAVEDSIRAIIENYRGMHLMEPWLGIPNFLFKPLQDVYAAAQAIKEALIDGDDRIDEAQRLDVRVAIGDIGVMQVTVVYVVRGDATERTLDFGYRVT